MLFLPPAELRGLHDDPRALEALLERRDLFVAFADGHVTGLAAAALLFADYAVMHRDATLELDRPEAWAAAVWRLGRRTLHWQLEGAHPTGIVDELSDEEPRQWLSEWMHHRSVMALDSAAVLIRGRGGDSLERAEFARLFAAGEPQKGLGAFLAKTRPTYS
jgi:enoyl-CoA hydratase/carnithine racemase